MCLVETIPQLMALHTAHLQALQLLSSTLQSSDRDFEEAKLALERWRDLGLRGERWEGVREWEELVQLELSWAGGDGGTGRSVGGAGKKAS